MRIRLLASLAMAACFAIGTALPAHAARTAARTAAQPVKAKAVPKARAAKTVRATKPTARKTVARRAPVAARRSSVAAASEPAPRRVKVNFARSIEPRRVSMGQAIGLHSADDPLDLRSGVALVVDQRTGEVLFSKNPTAVLPIASITKLMTAMVVLDARLPMTEVLEISEADIDTEKGTGSRLRPGTRLTRAEMLQLALMSSENRAANALGRHYPGGLPAFVAAMNARARTLGMTDTSYVEPTGLSSRNVSSARDLSRLVAAGLDYPVIRQFSTAPDLTIDAGYRSLSFRNTNRLLASPAWDIGLQKTGYISEAGSCLVMQVNIDDRPMVIVLLDALGVRSRFGDAERLRHWLENGGPAKMRTVASQDSLGS